MKHKAQKALDRLYSLRKGIKNDYPFTEKSKENKYDADDGIAKSINEDKDILQKLVDRTTPKLVKYEDIGYDHFGGGDNVYACICPNCGLHIIEFDDSMIPNCDSDEPIQMFHSCMTHHGYMGLNQFCNRCGQALDWIKEDVCN